jgi:hypothetical protein
MSKLNAKLSYKDWCILKHALQYKVDEKEFNLKSDEYLFKKGCQDFTLERVNKTKKELSEEKATLERITEIVDNFKDYIK